MKTTSERRRYKNFGARTWKCDFLDIFRDKYVEPQNMARARYKWHDVTDLSTKTDNFSLVMKPFRGKALAIKEQFIQVERMKKQQTELT